MEHSPVAFNDDNLNLIIENSELRYSEREKAIRTQFVIEFLKDRDQTKAAIRCGFPKGIAEEYATKFMEEPYVIRSISEKERSMDVENLPSKEEQKSVILSALFKEAQYTGPGASHAARVSALSKLVSIHDMDAPTKVQQEVTHKGGVMVVPGTVSVDEWEKAAIVAQAELTRDVDAGD